MKKFSKILSVALLVALVLSLGIANAFADPAPAYSITVTNDHTDVMSINGKEYKAYKVFDLVLGEPTTTDGVTTYGAYAYSIKNTDWAWATLTSEATTDAQGVITTKYGIVLTPSASNAALYSVDGENADARALADALVSVLPSSADGSATAANETATIGLDEPGYYAVYGVVVSNDPSQSPADEVVAALALTTTDPNAAVKPKASVPPLDKKITGVAEGTAVVDGAVLDAAGQAAVAKVGSTVSFELDSKVPDLTGYDHYTYTISDTMSTGLTPVKDSLVLTIVGKDASGAEVRSTLATDGSAGGATLTWNDANNSFTLNIPYQTLLTLTAGDAIVVTYKATVNSNALTYDKEINTANLTYSNNPKENTTNHTPDKKVYVIDINIDVLKTDGSATPKNLAGAEFKLYRIAADGTSKEYYKWDNNKVTWVAEANAQVFKTNADGHFEAQIQGLDKGTYFLLETKAPTGYNLLKAPVQVDISVNEADNSVTYTAEFDNQNATVTNGTVDLTTAQQGTQATTAQPLATGTVINNSGTELPSTGGIGTTIFYVVGGVLVLAAIILLVTKKRMSE